MTKPIAPPSKKSLRIIVHLNDRWRVADGPPHWYPQWILEQRYGAPGPKSSGWRGNAFCTDREMSTAEQKGTGVAA